MNSTDKGLLSLPYELLIILADNFDLGQATLASLTRTCRHLASQFRKRVFDEVVLKSPVQSNALLGTLTLDGHAVLGLSVQSLILDYPIPVSAENDAVRIIPLFSQVKHLKISSERSQLDMSSLAISPDRFRQELRDLFIQPRGPSDRLSGRKFKAGVLAELLSCTLSFCGRPRALNIWEQQQFFLHPKLTSLELRSAKLDFYDTKRMLDNNGMPHDKVFGTSNISELVCTEVEMPSFVSREILRLPRALVKLHLVHPVWQRGSEWVEIGHESPQFRGPGEGKIHFETITRPRDTLQDLKVCNIIRVTYDAISFHDFAKLRLLELTAGILVSWDMDYCLGAKYVQETNWSGVVPTTVEDFTVCERQRIAEITPFRVVMRPVEGFRVKSVDEEH